MDILGKKSLSNYKQDYNNWENPIAEITINGKKWESGFVTVSHLNVYTTTDNTAGACLVEFEVPENYGKSGKFELSSEISKMKIGVKIEISLGYKINETLKAKNKLKKVFEGYISALDIEIKAQGRAAVTLQGMDAKMWMMSNSKTELKKNIKKYSDTVSDIYKDYSGKLNGKKVSIKNEPRFEGLIYQNNESDYEFLSRMASVTGALFFINQEGKLFFISPDTNIDKVSLSVSPGDGFYGIKTSMDIGGIPKSVETVGINPKDYKKQICSKVVNSSALGSGKAASGLTNNINTVNSITIVDSSVTSAEEAKFISQSQFDKKSFNLVECHLKVAGIPDLELSNGLKIENMGEPFNNTYVITGIEHDLEGNRYITKLRLNANRYNPQGSIMF